MEPMNALCSPEMKNQQVVVVCDYFAIITGNILDVLDSLKRLTCDRSSALDAEGAVTLVFNGYDSDPRELELIPEVRSWFGRLYEAWPYWSFFACRTDQTVPLVLSLLLPGRPQNGDSGKSGLIFDFEELNRLLQEMFHHQNELIERLDISEDVNEIVTNDFIDTVQVYFS
jgi:hypothetical protein